MPEPDVAWPPSPEDVQPPAILDEVTHSHSLTVSPYLPKKYKNRSGTINFGNEYEWKTAALLSLRCIFSKEVDDMWMAMNVEEAGKFDDIILTLNTSGRKAVSYMIQLKHKDVAKDITKNQFKSFKGDFSLNEYFDSINKFQDSARISDLADFCNIYFVLFTNNTVQAIDFFVRCDDEQMKIINTASCQSYSIDRIKLNLETKTVCSNFRLLPFQLNVRNLQRQIVEELVRFCDSSNIGLIHPKAVVEDYIKFITEWSKGNLGGHYYLTKEIISQKLCELLLVQYEIKFHNKFLFYDSPQKLTWNEIVGGKEMTIVDYSAFIEEFLICYIGSELKRHFICVDVSTWSRPMSTEQEELFFQKNAHLKKELQRRIYQLEGITAYDLYSFLSSLKRIPKLLTVRNFEEYQSILNILNLCANPFKIILLSKCKEHRAIPIAQKQLFTNLKDLTEEHQDAVLKSLLKFDRKMIPVGDVLLEEVFHCITCCDIIHILCTNVTNNVRDIIHRWTPRISKKIFIELQALEELCDEIFVLNKDPTVYLRRKATNIRDVDWTDLKGQTIFIASPNEVANFIEELVNIGKPIHYLSVSNYCKLRLEWTSTHGSKYRIQKFMRRPNNKFLRRLQLVWSLIDSKIEHICIRLNLCNPRLTDCHYHKCCK